MTPCAPSTQHGRRLIEYCRFFSNRDNNLSAADPFDCKKFRLPHFIHQTHPQFVNDGLNLSCRDDQEVVLRFDENDERDKKKRCRPRGVVIASGSLGARIDGGEDRSVAKPTETAHDGKASQGALHFAVYELQERHQVGGCSRACFNCASHHDASGNTSLEKKSNLLGNGVTRLPTGFDFERACWLPAIDPENF